MTLQTVRTKNKQKREAFFPTNYVTRILNDSFTKYMFEPK